MADTAGDVFVDTIIGWGVDTVFGSAKFAEALAKRQPQGGRIALTVFRGKFSGLARLVGIGDGNV